MRCATHQHDGLVTTSILWHRMRMPCLLYAQPAQPAAARAGSGRQACAKGTTQTRGALLSLSRISAPALGAGSARASAARRGAGAQMLRLVCAVLVILAARVVAAALCRYDCADARGCRATCSDDAAAAAQAAALPRLGACVVRPPALCSPV
jgi:hypothetical protein